MQYRNFIIRSELDVELYPGDCSFEKRMAENSSKCRKSVFVKVYRIAAVGNEFQRSLLMPVFARIIRLNNDSDKNTGACFPGYACVFLCNSRYNRVCINLVFR